MRTTRTRVFRGVCFACLAALLSVTGCGGVVDSPEAVVATYFAALGRDPVRALPILAPAFHRQHGLYPLTTEEALRRLRGEAPRPPEIPAEGASVDAMRIAWLMVQLKPAYRQIAASLAIVQEDLVRDGDRARVRVRVAPGRAPAFHQTFELARSAPGPRWRIESVTQQGVRPRSRPAAAVAWPSPSHEAGLRAGARR